ncbi:MAG: Mbeg1-like protein [Candidatus Ventricola sp.]
MANIIDYVQWRGDIPLNQVPFGAVDALVLSYLSYMPFEGLVHDAFEEDGPLLSDAAAHLLEQGLSGTCAIDNGQSDCRLLQAIWDSERFGTMRLTGYVSRFDAETEEQFSAITFLPPQEQALIAFRGTDSTVVGWKEDFNMSFSTEVPAQGAALNYVVRAAATLPRQMILCGHSKGGNVAAYAGIFAPEPVQERIRCVYNFDGPGFNEALLDTPQFRKMDMRIHTFVPQSSMIGILMWHAETFIVVKSDGVGVLQHNPYSWQVMGGRFITLPERTRESRLAEETIKNWLADLAPEERKRFIDGVYSVLSVSDGRNVADLFEAKNVRAILRAVSSMDEETKNAIADAFRRLGSSLRETLPEWVEDTAGQIRTMIAQRSEKSEKSDKENG